MTLSECTQRTLERYCTGNVQEYKGGELEGSPVQEYKGGELEGSPVQGYKGG